MEGEINLKICYIAPKKDVCSGALVEAFSIKNKVACKFFTTGIVMLLACGNIFASATDDPIKKLGNDAIGYFQLSLTILAIIMALFECGKAMVEGDPKRIPSVVAKYGIAVICIYAIPFGYFKIKDAFGTLEAVIG